eukprot:gene3117-8205_t
MSNDQEKCSELGTPGEQLSDESFVRRTGWTWPLNWQQNFAWILIIIISTIHFGCIAPSFPLRWQATPYLTVGGLAVAAITLLFICTSLDPADPNVRYDTKRPVTIDRSKRKHVIINNHCYFCRVRVCTRSKHCSACFLAALGELAACMYLLIELHQRPNILSGPIFFGRDISRGLATGLFSIALVLSLLVIVSLGQLVAFHIMLTQSNTSTIILYFITLAFVHSCVRYPMCLGVAAGPVSPGWFRSWLVPVDRKCESVSCRAVTTFGGNATKLVQDHVWWQRNQTLAAESAKS